MMPSPAKILMTTDAVGGVWTYALELCRALPSVRFVLANMGPPPSRDQRAELAELLHVALEAAPFRLEWMEEPWDDVEQAGHWLRELEAVHQPDVVHLNGYVHAALPWRAPVVVAGHSCVLSWWRAVKGGPPPRSWDRYAAAVAKGLHACDRVITPSRAMGAALSEHYNIPEPTVIPNGRSSQEPVALTTEREPLILCAGRFWDEAKNISCLITAADGLAWPLVLAGDRGNDHTTFPNLQMPGFCSRAAMVSWFRRAAIYAHPARYEPFGLAPLEAALAGCALVLADIPSLREIWGDAAVFVSPDDPAAWRAALNQLINHPEEWERLCTRSIAKAKTYTPRRMAQAHLNVYRELLRLRQPRLSLACS